jgi:hypothetical protein
VTRSRAAFVVLVALALLLLGARAAVTVRDASLSDFRCFYEAGRLVRLGLDPYDRATWTAALADPGGHPPCADTFAYPLWTGMAFAPLSFFSEQAALAVWEIVIVASTVLSALLLAKTRPMPGGARLLLVVLLWSQPMFSAVANAQLGPVVLFALAAVAYTFALNRNRVAAAAWWLLLIKPNVIPLALVALPFLRSRRFAAWAFGGALVILLASLALVPTWPADVLRVIFGQQLLVDRDLGTLSALAIVAGLPSAAGTVAALVAVVLFGMSLPRRSLDGRELVAVLTVASCVVTPYLRPHDEVILAVCWAAAIPRAPAWVIGVALVLPWTITVLSLVGAPLAMHALVALATAVLTAHALRSPAPVAELARA